MESCARLLHRGADNPTRVREHADMVGHAATQIATLTNRMLDIARRRPAGNEPGGFDPYQAVVGLSDLLNRTLGGGCRVSPRLASTGPRKVMADRSEFESALVNLVVNARDAMPEGGEVVLWVGGIPPGTALPAGVSPPFVAIAVIDQGQGMDDATLARAGEPFFTTKQSGQGTGLGVAGARGFAERAGGLLTLHSRPGEGTVATLWLPVRSDEEVAPEGALSPSPDVA
jgi:signal transduction histidine kinase